MRRQTKLNSHFITVSLLFLILCITADCTRTKGRWPKGWEEKFEHWQPSEKVMDIFGIQSDMKIGEIGAGNGRFSVKMDTSLPMDTIYIFKLIRQQACN